MYTFNFKIQYKRQTLTVNIKKNFYAKIILKDNIQPNTSLAKQETYK